MEADTQPKEDQPESELSPRREVAMEIASDRDNVKESLSVDTSETETVSIDGDRLSIRSQDSSSTPTKPSSGVSTPTDKRSVTPPPGAPKRTPGSGGSGSKPPRASREVLGSPISHPNRPNRPGFVWKLNGKLEAMDFQKNWYPARIVDIDDMDSTALIHFDGWNQRYDEWMSMNSERLRPLARTSGRKEKKVVARKGGNAKPVSEPSSPDYVEHKVGDNVFAKWTDCRMYAGTIVGINVNGKKGSYDVLFYDGFKKTVQPINVKTMPLAVQKEYAVAGVLPHPSTRPAQKLHMLVKKTQPDEYKRAYTSKTKSHEPTASKDGMKVESATASTSKASSAGSSATSPTMSGTQKNTKVSLEKVKQVLKQRSSEMHRTDCEDSAVKKGRLVIGGNIQVKKIKSQSGQERDRARQKAERANETPALKSSLGIKRSPSDGSVPRVRKFIRKPKAPKTEAVASEAGITAPHVVEVGVPSTASRPTQEQGIMMEGDSTDEEVILSQFLTQQGPSSSLIPQPQSVKTTKQHDTGIEPLPPTQQVPREAKKAFQAEPEQKFTCPFHNCNKSFRKTSLVEYHVKYYHTEDGSVVQSQPPRKRKKTNSMCSSDSEVSFSSKLGRSFSGKKQRESSVSMTEITADVSGVTSTDSVMLQDYSEVEMLATPTDDHDEKESPMLDDVTEGHTPNMDCLNKDEVVNCICQLNEENGLMIQCDVCLCWQHAVCMELTEETLPAKYVCYVCTNPPGVRDNARYRYDQDWLKQGWMARFSFLPNDPYSNQKAGIMQATHSLVGDIHRVNQTLQSLGSQLQANQDKNHPEVKFWSKKWDKVIEAKKIKATEKLIKIEPDPTETAIKIEETDHIETMDVDQQDEESRDQKTDPENITIKQEPAQDATKPDIIALFDKTDAPKSDSTEAVPSLELLSEDNDDIMLGSDGVVGCISHKPITLSGHPSSSSLSSIRSGASENMHPSTSALSIASQDSEVFSLRTPAVALQEEPFVSCEHNLLDHISTVQDNVESRLDLIEEQISALESADDSSNHSNGNSSSGGSEVLRDLPRVKKAIHQILNDLMKVKRMALYR